MRYSAVSNLSFWRLIEQFAEDIKCFVKEEVNLVKAEVAEKIKHFARNAVPAAIGGCIAYSGVTVLFLAMGMAAAYGFQSLGLDPLLAAAAGLGAVALLVIATGAILLMKGIKAISKLSLKPDKTIETVENLKTDEGQAESAAKKALERQNGDHDRTSKEIQESVFAIEEEMADTLSELGRRVSLTNAREHANKEIRTHPYRWGLVAMGTGFAGSFLLKKKTAKLIKEATD